MRTLDAALQTVMDSDNFTPIVRAAVLDPDDHSVQQYLSLVSYKIHGLDIEIEFYDPSGTFSDAVSLERGAKIGEDEYTIFSGIYHLNKSFKVTGGANGLYSARGSLVEPSSVDVAADVTYHAVIDAVLALGTNAASWKNAAAAWLGYQFLADGKNFHTANIYTLFTLLKQKYLIYAAENGPDDLLFFSVADSLALASQYTLTLSASDVFSISSNYRQFIWKDEAGTTHQPGPAAYPIHNLGYLEAAASPPSVPDGNLAISDTVMIVIPNLKYQTGDCVKFDPGIPGYTPVKSVLDVTEIYDTNGRGGSSTRPAPAWRMELRPLRYFASSEGGVIADPDRLVTSFEPLSTSGFAGLLDNHVTNLQALADAVDALPALTGDGSGVAGRVAEFASASSLQSSGLALDITAGKVLTILATDDYSATVPGTGTFVMLETENTFTNVNTFTGDWAYANLYGIHSAGVSLLTNVTEVVNNYGYMETGFWFQNTNYDDGEGGNRAYAFGFGAEGRFSDAGALTACDFYIYNPQYGYYSLIVNTTGDIGMGGVMGDTSMADASFFIEGTSGNIGIGSTTPAARFHIKTGNVNNIGLLIMGENGQAEPYFSIMDYNENIIMNIGPDSVFYPLAAATASAPAYAFGGIWFDSTKDKLQVGGHSAWESVHSGVGSAYTQTYSTASATNPNPTAAALTDNTGGSANTTLESVGTTYSQSVVRNNFADLAAMVNKNTADHVAVAKLINQIIDDLQAMKIVT